MIEVQGLTKEYGDFTAVDHDYISIDSGEVFGLIGPNGAGKTTTLKMLAGLIEPTSGNATVAGTDIGDSEMAMDLGFLPETSPLYEEMTPYSYLNFFADLYNVPRKVAETRIDDLLTRLELEEDARNRKIGNLSKGMRRKVAIARSLINDPPVLIYDEPASGLDPLTKEHIIDFTKELRDNGKTILFSAHNLHQVESVCDRVAMMNEGRVVEKGTIEELRREYANKKYIVMTDVPVPDADPISDNRFRVVHEDMDGVERTRESARAMDGRIVDIETRESALEDIFLSVATNQK